jgi:prepilin-type processing-associated H-X9-DG protein
MWHEQEISTSWIFVLGPHLESVDEIRLCPGDWKRLEKESDRITSYAMNGYLRKPTQTEQFVNPETVGDFASKLHDLSETHKTIVAFEAGPSRKYEDKFDKAATQFDHLHSWEWFTELYPTAAERWDQIQHEVPVDRHAGEVANYLYADGHVEAIAASQISQWVEEEFNFARPPRN